VPGRSQLAKGSAIQRTRHDRPRLSSAARKNVATSSQNCVTYRQQRLLRQSGDNGLGSPQSGGPARPKVSRNFRRKRLGQAKGSRLQADPNERPLSLPPAAMNGDLSRVGSLLPGRDVFLRFAAPAGFAPFLAPRRPLLPTIRRRSARRGLSVNQRERRPRLLSRTERRSPHFGGRIPRLFLAIIAAALVTLQSPVAHGTAHTAQVLSPRQGKGPFDVCARGGVWDRVSSRRDRRALCFQTSPHPAVVAEIRVQSRPALIPRRRSIAAPA